VDTAYEPLVASARASGVLRIRLL